MSWLLSLCIPTYNRADVLDQTLATLLGDPDFDPAKVEVVVSDNCSTDHTRQVVEKYPGVCYFCNEENVRDENFSRALLHGRGAYLKLMNDTVRLRPGGLAKILKVIGENLNSEYPLFLIERGGRPKDVLCRTLGDFISLVSFRTTWIGNFGVWRRDLETVKDVSNTTSQLLQVVWSYRLAAAGPVRVYTNHYCTVAALPMGSKGGYNPFKVFVDNYLGLMRGYVECGKLSQEVFKREKRRVFDRYVWQRIQWLLSGSEELMNFDVQGAWEIIMRNYGHCAYFHLKMFFATLGSRK